MIGRIGLKARPGHIDVRVPLQIASRAGAVVPHALESPVAVLLIHIAFRVQQLYPTAFPAFHQQIGKAGNVISCIQLGVYLGMGRNHRSLAQQSVGVFKIRAFYAGEPAVPLIGKGDAAGLRPPHGGHPIWSGGGVVPHGLSRPPASRAEPRLPVSEGKPGAIHFLEKAQIAGDAGRQKAIALQRQAVVALIRVEPGIAVQQQSPLAGGQNRTGAGRKPGGRLGVADVMNHVGGDHVHAGMQKGRRIHRVDIPDRASRTYRAAGYPFAVDPQNVPAVRRYGKQQAFRHTLQHDFLAEQHIFRLAAESCAVPNPFSVSHGKSSPTDMRLTTGRLLFVEHRIDVLLIAARLLLNRLSRLTVALVQGLADDFAVEFGA